MYVDVEGNEEANATARNVAESPEVDAFGVRSEDAKGSYHNHCY